MTTRSGSGLAHSVATFLGVLAAAPAAQAEHFKPLSPHHTSYGVSQLVYGNLPPLTAGNSASVKLINPNHVTQAAATLIYSSNRGNQGAGHPTEVFLACKVRVVTPHGSTSISDAELVAAGAPLDRPLYSEHIWAPLEKVALSEDDDDDGKDKDKSGKDDQKKRRLADGLGGSAEGGFEEREMRLAHPSMFSLPSNAVVAGQKERAVRCICTELAVQRLPADTFSDFKVRCS